MHAASQARSSALADLASRGRSRKSRGRSREDIGPCRILPFGGKDCTIRLRDQRPKIQATARGVSAYQRSRHGQNLASSVAANQVNCGRLACRLRQICLHPATNGTGASAPPSGQNCSHDPAGSRASGIGQRNAWRGIKRSPDIGLIVRALPASVRLPKRPCSQGQRRLRLAGIGHRRHRLRQKHRVYSFWSSRAPF